MILNFLLEYVAFPMKYVIFDIGPIEPYWIVCPAQTLCLELIAGEGIVVLDADLNTGETHPYLVKGQ